VMSSPLPFRGVERLDVAIEWEATREPVRQQPMLARHAADCGPSSVLAIGVRAHQLDVAPAW
jgi:hypothetical protein